MSTNKKAQKLAIIDGRPSDQPVPSYEPAFEEIQARAYEAYVQRGRIDGFDLEDWRRAEEELRKNGNQRTD